MARIRSIKPEFWEDYRLAKELTRDQRLFYIALWNQADDAGRFLAHPRRLLGAVFPYDDDIKPRFIEDTLDLLEKTGRVLLYQVAGEPYGQLTRFAEHQRINRPTPSRIPSPDNNEASLSEDSVRTHDEISEASLQEQGKEGKGIREDVECVFGYWRSILEHPKATMTTQRDRIIRQRIQAGYSVDDLKRAIDGVALSDFHRGKYDDITSIFANDTRVEQHIERAIKSTVRPASVNPLFKSQKDLLAS